MLNRVTIAQACLESLALDALIFLDMANVRYLTGFSGSDGALVLTKGKACFLTDSRYTTQASQEVADAEVVEYRSKLEGIAGVIDGNGGAKIGFEAGFVPVAVLKGLEKALPFATFVPLEKELESLRILKDSAEILQLAKTAEIASEALNGILADIRPGVVERELALELEFAIRRRGADDKAFDFIVASGPRGALPHGRASEKAIKAGELVTIDFGAVSGGYYSDETVTVAVGAPDSRQRDIYQIVKDAHDRAIEAVRPGVSFRDLDAKARGFIEQKGYGQYFGHGLGHGVGLEVHEKPVVSYRSDGVAEEGMVFTIEPGIYIPDWGGVRIEDTVVVTADGCRILTKVSKELKIL